MIEVSKDKKSGMFIITRTDSEGFHKQMTVSEEELRNLVSRTHELVERMLCPLCGGELKWQSSVMGQDCYPGAYEEDDSATVSYYVCDRCGREFEVCDPTEEEREELKYWNDERVEKTI